MLFMGIDPGASGGIAVVDADGAVVHVCKMPETDRDVLDALAHVRSGARVFAVLEHVWSSPQMGVVSAFKFGANVGMLRMGLAASGIPYDEVTPQKWQAHMGCRAGGSRTAGTPGDKGIPKRRAQQLFPGVKVTNALADALLLAEYCRRMRLSVALATDPSIPELGF